jgi:chromosome partitioning protein
MPIIAVLNPKGGSGKTTISTNLARGLQRQGFNVLLVDSDPQGSARDWHAAQEDNPMPLVALDRANNFKTLPSVSSGYDFTIIDGAAKLEDIIAAAIKAADLVLIPVQPSPYDLWAVTDLIEIIKTRQEITDGKPKAAFLITRAIHGSKLGRDIVDALNEHQLPALDTVIFQRQAYPRTAANGATVYEGDNPDARAEIEALTKEILTYTNTQNKKGVKAHVVNS